MDDVSDLRTRLIYASLADDELVQQLREAERLAARQGQRHPAAEDRVVDVRDVVEVTRPWSTRPHEQTACRHRASEWSADDPSYYLG